MDEFASVARGTSLMAVSVEDGTLLELVRHDDSLALEGFGDSFLSGWCDASGSTLLHHGAAANAVAVCGLLLTSGIPTDSPNSEGLVPMHLAAAQGNEDIVMMLIERGAAVDPCDEQGLTPLDHAQRAGHYDCANALKHWRLFAPAAGSCCDVWVDLEANLQETAGATAEQLPEDDVLALDEEQGRRVCMWLEQGVGPHVIANIEQVPLPAVLHVKAKLDGSGELRQSSEASQLPQLTQPPLGAVGRSVSNRIGVDKAKLMVRMLQHQIAIPDIAKVCGLDVQDIVDFAYQHRWEECDVRTLVDGILHEPEEFLCPISLDLMVDPVFAADGFAYERAGMQRYLETRLETDRRPRSLKTNVPLANNTLVSAVFWRTQIFTFMERAVKSASLLLPRIAGQGFCDDALRLGERAVLYIENLGGAARYRADFLKVVGALCKAVADANMNDCAEGGPASLTEKPAQLRARKLVAVLLSTSLEDRPAVLQHVEDLGALDAMPSAARAGLLNLPVASNALHHCEHMLLEAASKGQPTGAEIDRTTEQEYLRSFY